MQQSTGWLMLVQRRMWADFFHALNNDSIGKYHSGFNVAILTVGLRTREPTLMVIMPSFNHCGRN